MKIVVAILTLIALASAYRVAFSKYFWVGDIREAIDENDMVKLEQLLEKNYDIDTTDYPRSKILRAFFEIPQYTPLDFACEKGSYEAVRMIVDAGADTNGIGENWTPLILTLQKYDADDLKIVQYLIQNGTDVDQQDGGDYPLTVAASMLVQHEKAGVCYYDGKRAAGVLEIIKLLLEHAENPEAKDSRGKSAFLCASTSSNLLAMECLAGERGYDVNETANNEQTAAFFYYDLDDPAWITAKISLLPRTAGETKRRGHGGLDDNFTMGCFKQPQRQPDPWHKHNSIFGMGRLFQKPLKNMPPGAIKASVQKIRGHYNLYLFYCAMRQRKT